MLKYYQETHFAWCRSLRALLDPTVRRGLFREGPQTCREWEAIHGNLRGFTGFIRGLS